jgi:hypothetical protein
MVTAAYPGSQASAISYPACGGQSSCGGASYDSSAQQGTAAVVSAVNSLNSRCPNTKIVLIGYSQVRRHVVFHFHAGQENERGARGGDRKRCVRLSWTLH